MTGDSSSLVILFVIAISIVVSMVILWEAGKRKQKLDESTTGTRNLPGLHLRSGEFVVRHDTATLAKFVWARVAAVLGHAACVSGRPFRKKNFARPTLAIWF